MVKHEEESHIWGAIGILLICLIGGAVWLAVMTRLANAGRNLENDPHVKRYNRKYGHKSHVE